ncbi:tetratricopeptide repeat protein [Melioribacter sp. Ez-97]|jgi:N-acetylmuramoyl-L-alanine amidase|uniref:tetratricopeptide repeat protein n=1 Tax=Melioribacter sp. Ez-97 TaxID=3423434 RepID=UPI003ED9C32D
MRKIFLFFFSVLLVSCSSQSDTEIFNAAMELVKKNDFQGAVNEYNKLVEEHPGSRLAPKALYEIAKIYHMNLIKETDNKESLGNAVLYYKRLSSEYPDAKESQKALFVAGYIEANELNDTSAARKTYEEFLKRYPESEMVASVKLELEYLGMPPDKLLEQRLKNQ